MSKKIEFLQSCVAIDTETTGKDFKTAEVIELGYTLYNDSQKGQETFSQLYKPELPLPAEVSGITHIDKYMLQHQPTFTSNEVDEQLHSKFTNPVYIAHNSFYDMKVLTRYGLKDSTWICTLRIAEKLLKGEHRLFNLPYLRYALDLGVNNDLACHRAGTDALLTFRLLEVFIGMMETQGLIDTNEDYLPQIIEYQNKPKVIDKMPFGKYKGQLLKDVPRSYWKWAIDNLDSLNPEMDNYDEELATAINKVL